MPPYLLQPLDIKNGDEINISLEENCIAVRKSTDFKSGVSELESKPELPMAFCCVCGKLLYTDGMKKFLVKYICHECVEVIKGF